MRLFLLVLPILLTGISLYFFDWEAVLGIVLFCFFGLIAAIGFLYKTKKS